MPVVTHNFSQGKMNKDMDERLVPNGQYREATNIQIATSDGSNVGTAQTLLGNIKRNSIKQDSSDSYVYDVADTSTVVGCISDPATDNIYYFVSSGDLNNAEGSPAISKDYIIQFDTVARSLKYVFVDIFKVKVTIAQASTSSQDFLYIPKGSDVTNQAGGTHSAADFNFTGVRIGMRVTGTLGDNTYNAADNIKVSDIIYNASNSSYKIMLEQNGTAFTPPTGVDASDAIEFISPRVLNFNKNIYITAINILDDFLFWTDNVSEPKKISISRSIAGTGGLKSTDGDATPLTGFANANTSLTYKTFNGSLPFFNTRLVTKSGSLTLGIYSVDILGTPAIITRSDNKRPVFVDESHVTVIKPSPTQAPIIDAFRTSVPRVNSSGVENPLHGTLSNKSFFDDDESLNNGDTISINLDQGAHFENGDILKLIRQSTATQGPVEFEDYDILARVISSGVTDPDSINQNYVIEIISISNEISASDLTWYVRIDPGDTLFDFKFPRFSYRYKFEDGEYSTFAPFSAVAFLTGPYDFIPEQGYNLGMINQTKSLRIKGYHPQEFDIPQDVVEIDILYKETNNPTVYIVKTIKPSDGHPMWPDQGNSFSTTSRGEIVLDTDTIYRTVPSNQLLRPYDNVPRLAQAQEISANRLIYGNYLQNYTVEKDPNLIIGFESTNTSLVGGDYAPPSVKSDRLYEVGVVFSDKYGRETPVISPKDSTIKLPHAVADQRNRLTVKFDSESLTIPTWAEYFSFYVKDSSDEYYNMTMDRWYYTSDENIWLSFPSSERNKITEDSYITLKKNHGSNAYADKKARYKVIDISNEVPDEVKTKRQNLGSIGVFEGADNAATSAIGDNLESGYPSVGGTFITVTKTAFEDAFGDNFQIKTPENLQLRFYGPNDNMASELYVISNLSQIGDAAVDGDYRLKIENVFGPDVEFILGESQQPADMRADLVLTLFADDTKMKAEYTGRFFVKVFKDDLLEQYIIDQTDSLDQQYEILATWGLRYLNNNGYWNAGVYSSSALGVVPYNAKEWGAATGTNFEVQHGFAGGSVTSGSIAHPGQHPTEHVWTNYTGDGFSSQSAYYWGGGAGTNSDDISDSFDAFGVKSGDLYYDIGSDDSIGPLSPLVGIGTGSNQTEAQEFWLGMAGLKDFFIDACTAYSWTGKGNQSDYAPDDDTPGNNYTNQYHKDGQSFDKPDTAAQEEGSVAPHFGTHQHLAGNTGYRRGQPSRGIWANGKCMDISWTGMGAGHQSGFLTNNDFPIAHQLKDVQDANIYSAAWKFMRKLCTPGTRFRFQRDPDGQVYTTKSFHNFSAGSNEIGWSNQSNNPGHQYKEGNNFQNNGGTGFDGSIYFSGTNKYTGVFGIRNHWTSNENDQYYGHNLRQRWTIVVDPPIGSQGSKYSPIHGTDPDIVTSADNPKFRRALRHDAGVGTQPASSSYPSDNRKDAIQIVRPFDDVNSDHFASDAAVWETEPKEVPDLDIYYQASNLNPIYLSNKTKENLVPIGSTFKINTWTEVPAELGLEGGSASSSTFTRSSVTHTVTQWTNEETISFSPALGLLTPATSTPTNQYISKIKIERPDGSSVDVNLISNIGPNSTSARLHGKKGTIQSKLLISSEYKLPWSNCWSFGNGVESDRVRDDFNAVQMDSGVKASTVLPGSLKEERRKHGMIWSGIYNSNSGVNDTNQFIQAEPITKDINPVYGSIQRLYNRNTRLIIMCEDKILRAETNKDMLFNADGNSQVVASNKVIGSATAYQGNYGIGKNPESFAATPYNIYFTDVFRGHVLVLGGEGVRSISDKGMRDYFADLFAKDVNKVVGSYDVKKGEYNIAVSKKVSPSQILPSEQAVVSFNEMSDGWTSFKTFYVSSTVGGATFFRTMEDGISLNNKYYTFLNGHIWEHHVNETRNNFYGTQYTSDVTVIFNDGPESVKSWGAIAYEGTAGRITNFDTESSSSWLTGDYSSGYGLETNSSITDGEYYNIEATTAGWYIDNIYTNLQECGEIEFKNKEGKYYGYPSGVTTALTNLDEREFTVQGLGTASLAHSSPSLGESLTITVANNTSTSYVGADGSGDIWDATAD